MPRGECLNRVLLRTNTAHKGVTSAESIQRLIMNTSLMPLITNKLD